MDIPKFLTLENNESLVFNRDNQEFIFYVPEEFFGNSKRPIAEISGEYVSMIGLCNWAIIDDTGKTIETRPFNFPTMFLCKPYNIEKVKNLKLENAREADDYRLLHFAKGDEVVSQIRVPQLLDNVEMFFKLAIITGKIPTSIPYDKLHEIFIENMNLNASSYGLNMQLFGIVIGQICRDPDDISKPFRYTDMKDLHNYQSISVKLLPNYTSPFTAMISEGFDESLRSAIMMSDTPEEDIPYSPLEKVLMQ